VLSNTNRAENELLSGQFDGLSNAEISRRTGLHVSAIRRACRRLFGQSRHPTYISKLARAKQLLASGQVEHMSIAAIARHMAVGATTVKRAYRALKETSSEGTEPPQIKSHPLVG
jgi:DNA-directed RNA polymerase specialized sigma24 family protein